MLQLQNGAGAYTELEHMIQLQNGAGAYAPAPNKAGAYTPPGDLKLHEQLHRLSLQILCFFVVCLFFEG